MTKLETVKRAIQAYGVDWSWDGYWVQRVAFENDCSVSTARKAIKELRSTGAFFSNIYTGREWVGAEEIMKYFTRDIATIVNDALYETMVKDTFARDKRVIYNALYEAIQRQMLGEVNGGSYGWMLRIAMGYNSLDNRNLWDYGNGKL